MPRLAVADRGLHAGAGGHRGVAVTAYAHILVVDAGGAARARGQCLQDVGLVLHAAVEMDEQPIFGQQRRQRRRLALQAQAVPGVVSLRQ
nr:hypothetical protein [Stenotrophomonas acidaminiphila]